MRVRGTASAGTPHEPEFRGEGDGADVALSTEERRLVELIVAGYTNEDMARHFSRSESTIHRRTARVLSKLDVTNKFELVLFAISRRIVAGTQPEFPA